MLADAVTPVCSRNANGDMICPNCGALPESVLYTCPLQAVCQNCGTYYEDEGIRIVTSASAPTGDSMRMFDDFCYGDGGDLGCPIDSDDALRYDPQDDCDDGDDIDMPDDPDWDDDDDDADFTWALDEH